MNNEPDEPDTEPDTPDEVNSPNEPNEGDQPTQPNEGAQTEETEEARAAREEREREERHQTEHDEREQQAEIARRARAEAERIEREVLASRTATNPIVVCELSDGQFIRMSVYVEGYAPRKVPPDTAYARGERLIKFVLSDAARFRDLKPTPLLYWFENGLTQIGPRKQWMASP
jgi:hypothetical protein